MRRLVHTTLFAFAVVGNCDGFPAHAADAPAEVAAISAEDAEFFERKIRPLLVHALPRMPLGRVQDFAGRAAA